MVPFALVFFATDVYAKDEVIVPQDDETITETQETAEYTSEITLNKEKWTGDNDVVLDVNTKGGQVNLQEVYVNDLSNGAIGIEPTVELDDE